MRHRLLTWIRGFLCVLALTAPAVALFGCEDEDNPVEEAAEEVEDAVD
jgi:hypothetical protein